jgi:hypothetical protein
LRKAFCAYVDEWWLLKISTVVGLLGGAIPGLKDGAGGVKMLDYGIAVALVGQHW